MTHPTLQKVHILLHQDNYQEAEKLLKSHLALEGQDTEALALLAQVYIKLGKIAEADELVSISLGQHPDNSFLFYLKAVVCLRKESYDDAEAWLGKAISIDPEIAEYHAVWSSVKLVRKQFADALTKAEQALSLDPENILALNNRSAALLQLNRKEAFLHTMEGALREDPDNAYTHANFGWGLLQTGDHRKALEHFRIALQQEPNNVHARAGMAEALKARYLPYRWYLQYSFWLGKMAAKNQWLVIVAFYFLSRLVRSIAASVESLRPIFYPLSILLMIVAFSTWVIGPIGNLLLRLHPYGKYLLDKKEIQGSNLVGISILVLIAGVIGYAINPSEPFLALAFFGFTMMVPLSMVFENTRPPHILKWAAVAMALAGIAGVAISFVDGKVMNLFAAAYIILFIAYQWGANAVMIRTNNR